jgi:hypothetical protein
MQIVEYVRIGGVKKKRKEMEAPTKLAAERTAQMVPILRGSR